MKKTYLFLVAISLLFASCEKTPVNEWSRFYGYTQADIVGHYEANPDESLYENLPTEGVEVYDNTTIDIVALSENSISLRIVIPGVINKSFSGSINATELESDLIFQNFNEDIMMTVYKNSKGQVRFHGRVKHYYYNADHELINSNNYGFDVIKASSESIAE
jgi:hypothetical protein